MEKYNINPTFFRRYFRYNAEMFYTIKLQDFMLFKKGSFLNPVKKEQYIDEITKQEINNFYENGEINIAKLDFDITSRCTLNCKYCSNLMPKFSQYVKEGKIKHIDTTFEEFKNDIDSLMGGVNKIGVLQILGGEPLVNKYLPEMIEYCALCKKINSIKIITNGTILPHEKLLDVIKKYKNKVFFYLSNYSANQELKNIVKYEQIFEILRKNDIKYQTMKDLFWMIDRPLEDRNLSDEHLKNMFKNCIMSSCLSVFNHKLHICAKSATAYELGLVKLDDYVDLNNVNNLRDNIIKFYEKDLFEICRYCSLSNEKILPAEQCK